MPDRRVEPGEWREALDALREEYRARAATKAEFIARAGRLGLAEETIRTMLDALDWEKVKA